jgi:hypothetical protein
LASGLTKDQAVRIYGFEATGNGTYQIQAGLEYKTPKAHAITTALGYNQLLNTNSVELMAEAGDQILEALDQRATTLSGAQLSALQNKIAVVRDMIEFSQTVPDDWGQHDVLAKTPKGLGVHAMNLDVDVGPLLQAKKLLTSVLYARIHGYLNPLTAAELEMMNLTGDGNGLDMVTMPQDWRIQVPTTNFFQPSGYQDNSLAPPTQSWMMRSKSRAQRISPPLFRIELIAHKRATGSRCCPACSLKSLEGGRSVAGMNWSRR